MKTLVNVRPCLTYTGGTIGLAVVICFILAGVLNAGEPMGLPTNVCFGDFCGPEQQTIWNRFQGATGLELGLIPGVYSGTCYHDNHAINPHSPQFGGVLIDKVNENVVFDGRFGFHMKTNPYEDLDLEAARRNFPENFEISLNTFFAYAEAPESFAPFRYWFRQEADTHDLLLVGYFGFDHTILCVLRGN